MLIAQEAGDVEDGQGKKPQEAVDSRLGHTTKTK